jgi:hypothetical protein
MNKILFLLLAQMLIFPAFGQKSKKDVVYLKTGAIIKGQILTNDLSTVKINSDGNLWVFSPSEIDSVSMQAKQNFKSTHEPKFTFDTSIGVLVGNSGNEQDAPFSFMFTANYLVFDKFYSGLGLGVEFFDESYMPAYAQFQYKFRNARFTPFVNLQTGYMVPLEDGPSQNYSNYYPYYSSYYPYPYSNSNLDTKGGFMINPAFGFQRFSSENFGWFFSFGYRYHKLSYTGENDYKLEENFSRLSLKIGFIFN